MSEKYCEKHDAYYDSEGNWLEGQCKGINCTYCRGRPERHLDDCECGGVSTE